MTPRSQRRLAVVQPPPARRARERLPVRGGARVVALAAACASPAGAGDTLAALLAHVELAIDLLDPSWHVVFPTRGRPTQRLKD